jgi:Cyclic nucleotide-binding domain
MPGWDVAIGDAISLSHLRSLPQDITDRLIRGATRLDAPAGKRFIHEGSASSMFLVVAGLVRGFLTSPSGRQSTIRYAKPGELIGTASAAVLATRAAICVAQFIKDPNYKDNLKALKAADSYERYTFVEKGGWDKMPGQKEASQDVSRACADGLEYLTK